MLGFLGDRRMENFSSRIVSRFISIGVVSVLGGIVISGVVVYKK
jgi:hypothetical protein